MPKVAVYNLEGSQTGELILSDEIFAGHTFSSARPACQ